MTTRQLTRAEIDRCMDRINEGIPAMDDFQVAAVRQAVAAGGRGVDAVDALLTRLAGTMNRITVPAIVEALTPPADNRNNVPYHLPTCSCGGEGWTDGPAETYAGRSSRTIVRCPEGGPITAAMWDTWQASAGQWTRPRPTNATERRAAARRMTAAARAALTPPETP